MRREKRLLRSLRVGTSRRARQRRRGGDSGAHSGADSGADGVPTGAHAGPGVDPVAGGLRWGDAGEDVGGAPNRSRATAARDEEVRAGQGAHSGAHRVPTSRGTAAAAALARQATHAPHDRHGTPGVRARRRRRRLVPRRRTVGVWGSRRTREDDGDTKPRANAGGRSLKAARHVVDAFDAAALWREGFSGKGVKTGVFDTGVRADHPHFSQNKRAHQLDARANAERRLGPRHVRRGGGGEPGRRVPGFRPRRGDSHLSGVHQRPGVVHFLVSGRVQLRHRHRGGSTSTSPSAIRTTSTSRSSRRSTRSSPTASSWSPPSATTARSTAP